MEEKVLINKITLKAITSDTRYNILKLLSEKNMTLSDISKKLKLSNSTVKEHLDLLLKSDLVKKEETNRKWKYYSLTNEGKKLIKPQEMKVYFAFLISLIATAGFALFFLLNSFAVTDEFQSISQPLNQRDISSQSSSPLMATSQSYVNEGSMKTLSTESVSPETSFNLFLFVQNNIYWVILFILILITLILLIIYLKKRKKRGEIYYGKK